MLKKFFYPTFVLILSLSLTLVGSYLIRSSFFQQDFLRLRTETEAIELYIESNISSTNVLLRTLSSTISRYPNITENQFSGLIADLNLAKYYPIIQDIGLLRMTYDPETTATVLYGYPTVNTNIPIGYDMYSEPERRKAIDNAIKVSDSYISNKLLLKTDQDKGIQKSAFLLFQPVYKNEINQKPIYLLYVPFRIERIFSKIGLDTTQTHFSFELYDSTGTVAYSSVLSTTFKNNAQSLKINLANNPWELLIWPNPQFYSSSRDFIPLFFLFSGLIVSFLLFYYSLKLERSQDKLISLLQSLEKTKESVLKSRQNLNFMVQNIKEIATILLDSDGRIITYNLASKDLFLKDPMKGKTTLLSILPRPLANKISPFTKKAFLEKTITYKIKNEEYFYKISSTNTPSQEDNNLIITIHDVTRQISENRQKDDFLSMASHELKTPLTSIKIYISLLSNKLKESADSALVNNLSDQVGRMEKLVDDILNLSRIQKRKLSFTFKEENLTSITNEILQPFKEKYGNQTLFFDAKETPKISLDKNRIEQVLINLITNAYKYSPDIKKIEIKIFTKDKNIIVSIKDSGIGIPHFATKRIFSKYFRLHDKNDKTYPGLGVGLYISKQIILEHKGKIWVENNKTRGSTFYFSLPITSTNAK